MTDMPPPNACLIGRCSLERRHTILLIHRGIRLGLATLLKKVKDQNSADCVEQELPSEHSTASNHLRGFRSSDISNWTEGAHPPSHLTQHCMAYRLLQQATSQCCTHRAWSWGISRPRPSWDLLPGTYLPRAQATGAEVRRAHPRVRATVHIRVLTEHVLCLVHDVLHLLNECLPLSLQDEVVLYLQQHMQPCWWGCA